MLFWQMPSDNLRLVVWSLSPQNTMITIAQARNPQVTT
jgi:hypothetical protein